VRSRGAFFYFVKCLDSFPYSLPNFLSCIVLYYVPPVAFFSLVSLPPYQAITLCSSSSNCSVHKDVVQNYRLNSDGSWDFYGRGWIQLVYARPRQQPQQRQQRDVIFHLLGEPMLRMHDEEDEKLFC
jgi:hypothetical protein